MTWATLQAPGPAWFGQWGCNKLRQMTSCLQTPGHTRTLIKWYELLLVTQSTCVSGSAAGNRGGTSRWRSCDKPVNHQPVGKIPDSLQRIDLDCDLEMIWDHLKGLGEWLESSLNPIQGGWLLPRCLKPFYDGRHLYELGQNIALISTTWNSLRSVEDKFMWISLTETYDRYGIFIPQPREFHVAQVGGTRYIIQIISTGCVQCYMTTEPTKLVYYIMSVPYWCPYTHD